MPAPVPTQVFAKPFFLRVKCESFSPLSAAPKDPNRNLRKRMYLGFVGDLLDLLEDVGKSNKKK